MMTDDIRDLLGRYATGSLTAEEQKRLFDAALDDQDLFEELAREDEMRELLAGPGVRDRLIRALEPPKRRAPWVLALAPVAVLSALLMVILMRPGPKPQQVAVATTPVSPVVSAPMPIAVSEPQPSGVPAPVKRKAIDKLRLEPAPVRAKEEENTADNAVKKDLESRAADQKEGAPKEAARKATEQLAAAPPAAPAPAPPTKAATQAVEVQAQATQVQVQGFTAGQQNAPGGPRQNAVQAARAAAPARAKIAGPTQGFGFHYSIQTAGHLIVIPSADGYLSVKSADGAVLFPLKRIAAGISTDIILPEFIRSVSILFSTDLSPAPPPAPTVHTAPEGTVQAPAAGSEAVAIEVKIKP